jgi:CHAT domain-containing protein
LYFAPEGFLSLVPFHALVEGNRFLIENHDVWINHSLLQQQNLYRNQHNSMTANVYFNNTVLLIGDPDYGGTTLTRLYGTENELQQVSKMFGDKQGKSQNHQSDDEDDEDFIPNDSKTVTYLGSRATVASSQSVRHPLVIHIAAHGEFWPGETLLQVKDPPDPIDWQSNPELLDGSFSKLDEALLRSSIILSGESKGVSAGATERQLTALELSSMNLLGADLLVLSACDTGLGTQSPGAGVLGFQYAVQSTMVRNALLSLWAVSDEVAPKLIPAIYEGWVHKHHSIARSYSEAMRQLCRNGDHAVHPYYWAPFILIEQSY